MLFASYNIHKGIGGRDRRYRLERILAVIEHEQPDFLCLQEVDRELYRAVDARLAARAALRASGAGSTVRRGVAAAARGR